jgi:[FeFe] hydrogenase H-cluster maturation GTPase HydF
MNTTEPNELKIPDIESVSGARATENTLSSTPSANRKHIAFFGNRNAGKSSLMNAILGQDLSIVSEVRGTTTDPVSKAMELLPYGPVVFIDTAGLDDDDNTLGALRVAKSLKILERTDFAVHVIDALEASKDPVWLAQEVARLQSHFEKFSISKLTVFNKTDLVMAEADGHHRLKQLKEAWPGAVWVSAQTPGDIHHLKACLIEALRGETEDETLVGDLVPAGGTIVLVVPIDSEAPKGRLILPQVQVIRDALDHGLKVHVVRDTELVEALSELKSVDLVVTDSQAFAAVSDMVPETIPLTSFSMVFARNKGDLRVFVSGIQAVKALEAKALSRQKASATGSEPIARILITESCTHNHSHEDIGRVKIPAMLNKKLGGRVDIDFKAGHDLPEDLSVYDLVVHCGSCMMNRKTMLTRIRLCEEAGTPITNYGVLLAYATGILERSLHPYALG